MFIRGSCLPATRSGDVETGWSSVHQHQAVEIARPEAGEQAGLAPGLLVCGLLDGVDGFEVRFEQGGESGARGQTWVTRTGFRLTDGTPWPCHGRASRGGAAADTAARGRASAPHPWSGQTRASGQRGPRRQPEQGEVAPAGGEGISDSRGDLVRAKAEPAGRCPRAGRGAGSVSASSQSLPVGKGAVSSRGQHLVGGRAFAGCAAPSGGGASPPESASLLPEGDAHPGQKCAGAAGPAGILHGEGSL